MDANLAVVLVAVIGVVVPVLTTLLKFVQDRSIAREQTLRADTAAAQVQDVAARVEAARRDLQINTQVAAAEIRKVAVKVEEVRVDSAATQAVAVSEAQAVAARVEEAREILAVNTAEVGQKLDVIHTLVNDRLSLALEMISQLKSMLIQVAPNDPRVKAILHDT
jgi:hypothetical protein